MSAPSHSLFPFISIYLLPSRAKLVEPDGLPSMGSHRVGHNWSNLAAAEQNLGFPGGTVVKNLPANAEDIGLISGLRRFLGEGNSNTLQYSCLENPMDRGAWRATVHGVTKNWTWLSDWAQYSTEQNLAFWVHTASSYLFSFYILVFQLYVLESFLGVTFILRSLSLPFHYQEFFFCLLSIHF